MSDDERAQFARNCKPGCPGPELLEVARGGHSCDSAIARAGTGALRAELERARATAAELEDQLARIEVLARTVRSASAEQMIGVDAIELCDQLLEIVTGADVERVEALAALAAEPVVPS